MGCEWGKSCEAIGSVAWGRCVEGPAAGLALPTACLLQEFVWEASHYLVRQVFSSLQEMFSGTRAIQVCVCCLE
jgi:hypothetical protein